MMNDILYIDGEAMDMAENKAVTLTFKSPILTDISKQSANYSQTINLPRTPRNERLLGLPLSVDARSNTEIFRYKKKPARLDRNGITIAEGDVYLLDSSGDAISVAFIFGRIPLLEWIKNSDATINQMGHIERMEPLTWNNSIDTSIVPNRMMLPLYNTGATLEEMSEAKVGFYGAVSVHLILIAIAGGKLELTEGALAATDNLFLMCSTANDSEYTANLSATRFALASAGANKQGPYGEEINGNVWRIYEAVPFFGGTAQYTDKYGEIVSANIGSVTRVVYQASASQRLTIIPNDFTVKFRVGTHYDIAFGRLQYSRLLAIVYNPATEATRRVYGSLATSNSYDSSYNSGSLYGYKIVFKDSFSFDIEEGEQVQLRVMIPTPTNDDTSMTDFSVSQRYEMAYRSSALKEPIHTGEIYHPAGNLPNIKGIDFLKGISAMLGLYMRATPSGLTIGTLNEVLDNLATAEDWSSRVVLGDKGELITHHYFSVGDYKAQRNVIAFKEDNNDPDKDKISESARKVVLSCINEGLEPEKTLVTLPFAQTYSNSMRHYEFKPAEGEDKPADVERKELAPRIVRLYYNSSLKGVCADNAGLTGTELSASNHRALQDLVREPHRIKLRMRLTTIDLMRLNLERPIYLAQFGQYFLIEEIQTTSTDICDVILIKINS